MEQFFKHTGCKMKTTQFYTKWFSWGVVLSLQRLWSPVIQLLNALNGNTQTGVELWRVSNSFFPTHQRNSATRKHLTLRLALLRRVVSPGSFNFLNQDERFSKTVNQTNACKHVDNFSIVWRSNVFRDWCLNSTFPTAKTTKNLFVKWVNTELFGPSVQLFGF